VLFHGTRANPDGSNRASRSGYQHALGLWLRRCDIRDEHPVISRRTSGGTLGTVLINRDVPQHVVQKSLDHDSPLMTTHYARLSICDVIRQDRP
jgi:integrase